MARVKPGGVCTGFEWAPDVCMNGKCVKGLCEAAEDPQALVEHPPELLHDLNQKVAKLEAKPKLTYPLFAHDPRLPAPSLPTDSMEQNTDEQHGEDGEQVQAVRSTTAAVEEHEQVEEDAKQKETTKSFPTPVTMHSLAIQEPLDTGFIVKTLRFMRRR